MTKEQYFLLKDKLLSDQTHIDNLKERMRIKGLSEEHIRLAVDPLISFSLKLKEDIEEYESLNSPK